MNISGTVSKPPSAVTVNGKPATINGNSWSVLGIPTGGRELRYFDMNVDATVVEEEGGSPTTISTTVSLPRPDEIHLSLYTKERDFQSRFDDGYSIKLTNTTERIRWSIGWGGWSDSIVGTLPGGSKTLRTEIRTQPWPGAAWSVRVENYTARWLGDGTSSWESSVHENDVLITSSSGNNVPPPGAFQVRNYVRTYAAVNGTVNIEWRNAVRIDSDANVYAMPEEAPGTRFLALGSSLTALAFQNASDMDPTQGTPVPGKLLTFFRKDLNADSLRMYPIMAAVQQTGKPSKAGGTAVNFNWLPFVPGNPRVFLYISYHKDLFLESRDYHPQLQRAVNQATEMLDKDDDAGAGPIFPGKIEDSDPRVWPFSPTFDEQLYLHDDVPARVDFRVMVASRAQFPCFGGPDPCGWGPGGNGFAGNEYLDVPSETQRDALMNARFANAKIVRSLYPIPQNGQPVTPAAWGAPGPSYLVKGSHVSDGQLFAHEFGHSQGLPHREDIGPVPGSNPGADEKAIMHWQLLPVGKEINRNERGAFASPIAEGWNQR